MKIKLPIFRALVLLAATAMLAAVDPPQPPADGALNPVAAAVPFPPDVPMPQAKQTVPSGAPTPPDVPEIVVEAPEPRYVAPTRRDRIGRIWAPVMINGKGPFRLVLDTGASHSAVNAEVARELGLPLLETNQLTLRGITGSRLVPTIPVESMVFGDLEIEPRRLPIVTDALGGAEGVLGAEGLMDKRIVIDFRHDQISIKRSHLEKPERGMVTVPFRIVGGLLTVVDARIGDLQIKAIIDTGGQVSIGNLALRSALLRISRQGLGKSTDITGATLAVQQGDRMDAPPIVLGGLTLLQVRLTISDLYIFRYWRMTGQPTILVGMDLLGLLDTLVIDYRRRELFIRMR